MNNVLSAYVYDGPNAVMAGGNLMLGPPAIDDQCARVGLQLNEHDGDWHCINVAEVYPNMAWLGGPAWAGELTLGGLMGVAGGVGCGCN